MMIAVAPMALDICLSFTGLWTGAGIVRFITGLAFGILISSLLVRSVTELLRDAPWRLQADSIHSSREAFNE